MPRLRGIITVASFLILTAISVAAAVQAVSIGLPETLASNTTVLIDALSTDDVTLEPRATRLNMAQRVHRELSQGVDWDEALAGLTPPQRDLLIENVAELAKESFDDKVTNYFRREREQDRKRYLDRQLDEFLHWAVIVENVQQSGAQGVAGNAALLKLLKRAGQWYRNATPEEIERLKTFQGALQDRMKARMQKGFNPNKI